MSIDRRGRGVLLQLALLVPLAYAIAAPPPRCILPLPPASVVPRSRAPAAARGPRRILFSPAAAAGGEAAGGDGTAGSFYLQEMQRYRDASCDDSSNGGRPLVK